MARAQNDDPDASPRASRRPTAASIAAQMGLSRATVAHVLSGRATELRIHPETQRRVLAVASELGYHPNALARSVRSGKSNMIGYIVDDPRYEPYWNTIIGALAEAEQQGYTLKLLSANGQTFAQRIEQCMQLQLAGIIVRASHDKSPLFEEADRTGIPVVTVDESQPQPFGVRVTADDAIGCREAISHLIDSGHRRIGFISSGFPGGGEVNIHEREKLFLAEMAARGREIPEGYVTRETMLVYGPSTSTRFDPTTVLAATSALLTHPAGPATAIFCWRDETALMALRACRRAGLRIPQDISIVGFSDITAARLNDPTLSTCQSPWEEMGRTAVRQLIQASTGPWSPSPSTVLVSSSFVARESSGSAPS